MPDFPDKLRLKEQAEEDIYFAKRDRERIKALHEKLAAEQQEAKKKPKQPKAGAPPRKRPGR
jgi:hypothetical protein